VLGQLIRYVAENLPALTLNYGAGTASVYYTKVRNVSGGARGNTTWNVHEWELR
jgi:hypothetical protein